MGYPSRQRLRLLAWALVTAASAAPATAQIFHSSYFVGDTGSDIASVRRTDDGGFVGVGQFAGVGTVFKLKADGSIVSGTSFGPVRPVAVRPTAGGGIAWIGNVPDPTTPVPIFVLADAAGTPKRTLRFAVPQLRTEIVALEEDPRDGGFWVGGNAWVSAKVQMPWLAHLDKQGALLWIGAFQRDTGSSVRLEALVPTNEPGTLAVGNWVWDGSPTDQRGLFAMRVNGKGGLLWARSYYEHVARDTSEQWFVDVTRDPRSTGSIVYAAAHVDKICGINTALPCIDLFTGGLIVAIDENSGDVDGWLLAKTKVNTASFEPTTIVRDEGNDLVGMGGVLDKGTSGSREATLVLARLKRGPSSTLLGARSYGDRRGPFTSQVADLSLYAWPTSPVREPGFVLANHQSGSGTDRPTVLTTDVDGKSAPECEEAAELFPSPTLVSTFPLILEAKTAAAESFILTATPRALMRVPCLLIGPVAPTEKTSTR